MKSLFLIATILSLTSCGRTTRFERFDDSTVTVTSVSTSTATSSLLQEVLNEEDAYLESVGQHDLIPGLSCTIYTVPTSTTGIVQATNSCSLTNQASFSYTGQFNQPLTPVSNGLNILPTALQSVYQTWFIVKCYGYLVNLDNNYHQFSLTSDDGSLLYVDGLLVNNDGLHSTATVSNSKLLTVGAHYFELDFFQGGGMQSLILNEDGVLLNSNQLYH